MSTRAVVQRAVRRQRERAQDPLAARLRAPLRGAAPASPRLVHRNPPREHRGLLDYFGSLYVTGTVPVTTLCEIAGKVAEATPSEIATLKRLLASEKNRARTFTRLFGISEEERHLFMSDIPLNDGPRGVKLVPYPFRLPSERVAEGWQDASRGPPLYLRHLQTPVLGLDEHPVVRAAGGLANAVPLKLFADGVGWTNSDSFVVYTVGSLFGDTSDVCAAVRKSDLCCCGCHGVHTFDAIEAVLAEDFCWLAQGVYPRTRVDGLPWSFPRDTRRAALAGQWVLPQGDAGAFGVLYQYQGDLKQFAEGLGLPHFMSPTAPCAWCYCTMGTAFTLQTHRPRTAMDYNRCVCEQQREVTVQCARELAELSRALAFSKARRGRAVRRPNAFTRAAGLEVGDRVVAGGSLTQRSDATGLALTVDAFPATIRFFRSSAGFLKFVTRWLKVPGFVLPDSLRLDVMHVRDLGITARYIGTVHRRLLAARAFAGGTEDAQLQVLVDELRRYYKEWDKAHGTVGKRRRLCRFGKVFGKLLGPADNPKFRGKAAETRDLLDFTVRKLEQHVGIVDHGYALLKAGKALVETYTILKDKSARQMTAEKTRAYRLQTIAFLRWWRCAGGICTIKNHYDLHLADQVCRFGNASFFSHIRR